MKDLLKWLRNIKSFIKSIAIRDVPIHRFRSVSATDPVVLTNIELTDIGSVNRSDADIIELYPPACNCIF